MSQYEGHIKICPYCGYIEDTKVYDALHMEPGSILRERYIVGKALGFGGFGVTYIGWDAVLEQKVAIKEYLPSEFSTRVPGQTQITVFSGDKSEQFGDGLSKFIDEAQRLAKFHQEDGVVRIFDSFEANNTAYIIMELLQGETLAEYLKRVPKMPAGDAISMLMPIIHSLQAINERGIIHRDIAPDNIFLTDDGNVKLIDFGAARFATTSHSRSLTVIIKPGYSPEEQYRSRGDQGSHTDVYAIGATLYRMITGEAPPDAMERRAHFEGKQKDILIPLVKLTKDITENQETAILNALNVRIEDRTQDMATLARELTTEEPEKVKRLYGKIKKIDVLKWPLWAKISAPAAMLAVIVLSTLFLLGIIGFDAQLQTLIVIPDGQSRVPSVISNDMDQASTRLAAVTLQYSIIGRDYDERVPANLVLTQHISGGQVVVINSVIEITISGGAETVTVPDASGLGLDDARALLEELGFAVFVINEYSDVFAAGAVISQNIEPDSNLSLGSTVTLIVSQGVNPYETGEQRLSVIPALVGIGLEEALEAAQQAGFVVSVRSREYSYEFARDIVMFQDLTPGTELLSGNTIELVVSLGVQQIRVPDVQFRTEAEAAQHIANAGLLASITRAYSETVASGLVISQSPAADTIIEPGGTVSIIVSAGGESFGMPNVVGMTEAAATAAITGRGLSVSVEFERNDNVAEGNVIRQSIASGASVNRGTRVTVTVSSGRSLVQVANVVGRPQSEAGSTLRGQGFDVTVNEAASEDVAAGNVISQSLAAGSSQISGTQIIITVSTGMPVVNVPSVVGRTQSAAETTLRNAGFAVSTTSDASTTVPEGSVISQLPASGTAVMGTAVALVISTGPADVRVTNVVGQTRTAAESTIRGQGLTVSVVEIFSETVTRGNVISQTPAAGATVSHGSAVTINVSRGADTVTSITVRNAPSRTVYNVGETLNTAGLSLNVTWASGDTTIVTSGFTVSPTVLNTQGTQVVTVTFSGRTTTFDVTVNAAHIPVTSITGVPTSVTAGTPLTLTGTVNPSNATNRTVTWSIENAGTTGATISGNTLRTTAAGSVTITATVANGTAPNSNYTQNFTVTVNAAHVPVTSITGLPTTMTAGTPLTLTGMVNPSNATNRTVTWSIANAGATGATISGNTLRATAAGTVTVRATVANGTAQNTDFVWDFAVAVTVAHVRISNITGIPASMTAGTPLQLNATVNPSNATYRTIIWSVVNAGTTGATISGNNLNATAAGTATIMATVVNGAAPGSDYTQNFTVTVNPLAPDVAGLNRFEAERVIRAAGFEVEVLGNRLANTAHVPDGNVIRQTNMTNRIRIEVRMGPVPNVIGQSRADAERILRNAGYDVIIEEEHHATVPAGNVIRQIVPGTVQNPGIFNTIVVSLGPDSVQVPNVVRQTRANAETTLRNAGFEVVVEERNRTTVVVGGTAVGSVDSQSPAAGTALNRGQTVTIVVIVVRDILLQYSSMPGGTVGVAYVGQQGFQRGRANARVVEGSLPGGLTLSNSGGISGTPTVAGKFYFTMQWRYTGDNIDTIMPTSITIAPAQARATATLRFEPEGGTGGPGVITMEGPEPGRSLVFYIPQQTPTRPGHVFIGWETVRQYDNQGNRLPPDWAGASLNMPGDRMQVSSYSLTTPQGFRLFAWWEPV